MAGTTRCTMDRGLRNVLVVSLGFLLLFTAYGGLQNLQVRGHGRRGVWDCRPCDSAKPSGTAVVSGGRPRAGLPPGRQGCRRRLWACCPLTLGPGEQVWAVTG